MRSLADSYTGYTDLANAQTEGTDYRVLVCPNVGSSIAIIAPHGGSIEQYTSDIACGVAGADFNLYLFEGIRQAGNYAALHLTSHRFDEPRCLSLLSNCNHVVAIHGCSGDDHRVLLGGRDEPLKLAIGQALTARGIDVRIDGHPFPATEPKNICNRGRRGVGVQVEMTMGLRLHGPRDAVCAAIRSVLLTLPNDQGRIGPMILTDNETKIDLLNNEAIATTIVRLLGAKPDHPVTIGVHGDWGAGKSSVLEMIETGFANKDDVLCLKFNGWRFQGFEDAKIALIEGIVTGLVEKRPALTKTAAAVKDVFRRIDWLKVAKRAGGLAVTAFTGIPTPEQVGAIVGSLEAVLADPAKLATKENLSTAIDHVKAVLKPGDTKNVPEEVEAFRKAFDKLLKDAGIEQLIVLIDDLDRCLPDTAIETLEAIRLFVFTARTAFVVAADEAMIEYAVRKHFPDLPDSTGPRDYARNYLEKLIQVPFRIPALGETETRIYVTLLLAGAEIGENDADYAKLIGVAREELKRPWTSGGLDAATIKTALGKQAEKANNALALSDQIGPILASGTKGNPRQIKRFLNTLLLRERTAAARGFGDDIKLPVLAKLMLAERFVPRLFEQIAFVAAVHPRGLCEDLESLERGLTAADSKEAPASERKGQKVAEPAAVPDNAVLAEWRSSDTVCDWARLSPKLSGIDLRPYLFVTKDKKDYFGPVSVLGHLAGVVEKLFGGRMTVQGYEAELKRLVQPEADKVFEAVRTKIMSTGTFDTKPAGIDGLVVLVKAQPGLQGRLMDFLEALPSGKCGPWAVSGWQGVIKDAECSARLTKLLGDWSKAAHNPGLSASAEAALKDLRGSR